MSTKSSKLTGTCNTIEKWWAQPGYSSAVEHLPWMCEALDVIPSIYKQTCKNQKNSTGGKAVNSHVAAVVMILVLVLDTIYDPLNCQDHSWGQSQKSPEHSLAWPPKTKQQLNLYEASQPLKTLLRECFPFVGTIGPYPLALGYCWLCLGITPGVFRGWS